MLTMDERQEIPSLFSALYEADAQLYASMDSSETIFE